MQNTDCNFMYFIFQRNRLVNIEFGKLRKAMKKSGGKKK